MPETEKKLTVCDQCANYLSFLAVAWGRKLNDREKKFNELLIKDGKAEMCQEYNRFFNKSFKKRTQSCEMSMCDE